MQTGGRKIPGHGYVGEKYVERKIRLFFDQEWTASTREDKKNENFYSFCIFENLKDCRRPREEKPTLNDLKGKLPDYVASSFSPMSEINMTLPYFR